MPDHKVHVPEELRPALAAAKKAYAGWLESRDADEFFADETVNECEAEFSAAIDELVAGSLSAGVELLPLQKALTAAFPEAVGCGLIDLSALASWAPDAREAVEPLDGGTSEPAPSPADTREATGPLDAGPEIPALAPGTVGSFHSVHPREIVMEIVRLGVRDQLSSKDADVSSAGVLASIYINELSDYRLVVTAGNVLETYFSFAVDLTDGDGGTRGLAYYDRPMSDIKRWYKNAIGLASGVQSILVDASATIIGWNVAGTK